jgi:hypothetical protein
VSSALKKQAHCHTRYSFGFCCRSCADAILCSIYGAAIGEFFRDTGRPALVFMMTFRNRPFHTERCLTFEKTSGREAYPGDVFYLHSRLLERAAKIINNDAIAQKHERPSSVYQAHGERWRFPYSASYYRDSSW